MSPQPNSRYTPPNIRIPKNVTRLDTRIAYGAGCTWWDSIRQVGKTQGSGLPCCPHCGSVLYEVDSIAEWWSGVDQHEANGHPGYRAMIEWGRGRCYRDFDGLEAAFTASLANP